VNCYNCVVTNVMHKFLIYLSIYFWNCIMTNDYVGRYTILFQNARSFQHKIWNIAVLLAVDKAVLCWNRSCGINTSNMMRFWHLLEIIYRILALRLIDLRFQNGLSYWDVSVKTKPFIPDCVNCVISEGKQGNLTCTRQESIKMVQIKI
jgi:hypothetical protein